MEYNIKEKKTKLVHVIRRNTESLRNIPLQPPTRQTFFETLLIFESNKN